MERNRRSSFKKRSNSHIKQGGNKRGKFNEQSSETSQTSETVYRLLCPSRKIGSVIGKGGGIIKSLREETGAKITVAEIVPGSEERVITVNSPSAMLPLQNNHDMELYCAAQDALLRIHDRIVAEDLIGGTENSDDIEVIARMLVPNNTVGCVIGKKGDVITRLRSETGAGIRVLPTDQHPTCALSTDELVQISAIPSIAKRALYEVSTLLHHNPRKDKPPSSYHSAGGHGSVRPGPPSENMSPMNLMRPERGAPSLSWMGMYNNEPPRFGNDGFNGDHAAVAAHSEDTVEFSMKILCSERKIGGIIGKGGSNVRQLQQQTGTSIDVDDKLPDSDERVIRVSSFEDLRNPRSNTIDTVLFLQDKTTEFNEKGMVTSRLLIPSNKIGCIIGQGGQVINEMRRRTRADIRVYSDDEKPICADEDEELVQVSGSYGVAKDALAEIASRFRARCFRDANPETEPAPLPGIMPQGNLAVRGPPPFIGIRGGPPPGGYAPAPFQGAGLEYGSNYPPPPRDYAPHTYAPPPMGYAPHAYTVPPHAYPGAADVNMPNSGQVSGVTPVNHNISEVKVEAPYVVGPEPVAEMHGSSQQDISGGSGGQNNNPHQVLSYDTYGTQQGPFSDMNPSSHTSYTETTTNTTHPVYPPQQVHYPETSYQYAHGPGPGP
ncbi:KH domain-containing protein At4g18375-like isoform X2 [Rutidosis leptorrhynchoides]|uniref:KH domain-containing protein At4g18375-like isoform X2 n=1 Tax=Rutidosis leptorrhynchoides TaxID=125765 RepID=UPI003A9928A1